MQARILHPSLRAASRAVLLVGALFLCACPSEGGPRPEPFDAGTPPIPRFTLELEAAPVTVAQGARVTTTVRLSRLDGFREAVSLELSDPPAGLSAPPLSVGAGESQAEWLLEAAPDAPVGGPHVPRVHAVGGGLEQQGVLTVHITRPPPGSLDPTFGRGGRVVLEAAPGSLRGGRSLPREDGTWVIAAQVIANDGYSFGAWLDRFLVDGRRDPAFRSSDVLFQDFLETTHTLVRDGDGALLCASEGSLSRYLRDGGVDVDFGSGGLVRINELDHRVLRPRALAVLPEGRLLLGGGVADCDRGSSRCLVGCDGCTPFGLARLTPLGALDTSFGHGGFVATALGQDAEVRALRLQQDGRVIAAGVARTAERRLLFVARFLADGTLDPGFHGTGVHALEWNPTGRDWVDVSVLSGGEPVVVVEHEGDFRLVRFTSAGELDASFGTGGIVTTDFLGGVDEPSVLVPLAGDRLLVGGTRWADGGGSRSAVLARYQPDGTLDAMFGSGGRSVVGPGGVWALHLLPDGHLFVLLREGSGFEESLVLGRILP
ncbi:delta-60 repeat domain-containing protein [Cystobacter fuscus]|nr:delta-60 repeat domain-containing protein [Cystobacter fuscus]